MSNIRKAKTMDNKDSIEDQTKLEVKINRTKIKESSETVSNKMVDELIANNSQGPTEPVKSSYSSPKKSRGLVVSALAVIAIVSVSLLAVINNGSSPEKAKIVKASKVQIATVQSSAEGFSPATIVVKKGTVVSWSGPTDGGPVIVASNPYPSGKTLKTLKSSQLSSGATYRYKFLDSGTYTYHDDLNPSNNGTIVVQ